MPQADRQAMRCLVKGGKGLARLFKTAPSRLLIIAALEAGLLAVLLISGIGSRLRSLMTLKKLDRYPFYTMTYYGGYRLLEPRPEETDRAGSAVKPESYTGDGCSCFAALGDREEMVYGRNLDLSGYHPALLLYTDPPDGYASVSMVELGVLGFAEEASLKPKSLVSFYFNRLKLLNAPLVPRDGINQWGLVVSTLNAPQDDPGKPAWEKYPGRWAVTRLLLDKARDVDEAINLLTEWDIYFNSGVHYLIADSSGNSAVVEFIGGRMTVTRTGLPWQAAANFLLGHPERPGTGHQRFELMEEVLREKRGIMTEEEAMELLKDVSQDSTCWSVVYNISRRSATVVLGRNYWRRYRFNLPVN